VTHILQLLDENDKALRYIDQLNEKINEQNMTMEMQAQLLRMLGWPTLVTEEEFEVIEIEDAEPVTQQPVQLMDVADSDMDEQPKPAVKHAKTAMDDLKTTVDEQPKTDVKTAVDEKTVVDIKQPKTDVKTAVDEQPKTANKMGGKPKLANVKVAKTDGKTNLAKVAKTDGKTNPAKATSKTNGPKPAIKSRDEQKPKVDEEMNMDPKHSKVAKTQQPHVQLPAKKAMPKPREKLADTADKPAKCVLQDSKLKVKVVPPRLNLIKPKVIPPRSQIFSDCGGTGAEENWK
jgi:hypothetical protein